MHYRKKVDRTKTKGAGKDNKIHHNKPKQKLPQCCCIWCPLAMENNHNSM